MRVAIPGTSIPGTSGGGAPHTGRPLPYPQVQEVDDMRANRQIRTVYANDKAASVKAGEPYPYGSVLVGEFAPAKRDAQGLPELDANGRFQREGQPTVFVMC